MMRSVGGIAMLMVGLIVPIGAAQAKIYEFSGYCSDCGQPAAGLLTLDGEQAGAALTAQNVVSFAYFGSNLLAPFVETAPSFVFGTLTDAAVQSAQLQFVFDTYTLATETDGSWIIRYSGPVQGDPGNGGGIDQGYDAAWTAVPEPGSAVLVLGALGAASIVRRRRATHVAGAITAA